MLLVVFSYFICYLSWYNGEILNIGVFASYNGEILNVGVFASYVLLLSLVLPPKLGQRQQRAE